ncbi:MAG: hypothetical protein J3K34DRAFT_443875 [Monoraphidium minutum]|nr:MAG: hypothetical protein J3K34DRAFT_443875 [Monoraphidium minutum]
MYGCVRVCGARAPACAHHSPMRASRPAAAWPLAPSWAHASNAPWFCSPRGPPACSLCRSFFTRPVHQPCTLDMRAMRCLWRTLSRGACVGAAMPPPFTAHFAQCSISDYYCKRMRARSPCCGVLAAMLQHAGPGQARAAPPRRRGGPARARAPAACRQCSTRTIFAYAL